MTKQLPEKFASMGLELAEGLVDYGKKFTDMSREEAIAMAAICAYRYTVIGCGHVFMYAKLTGKSYGEAMDEALTRSMERDGVCIPEHLYAQDKKVRAGGVK